MLNILLHKSIDIPTEIKPFLMLLDKVRKKKQLTASSVLKNIQIIKSEVYSMYVPLILPCCQGSFQHQAQSLYFDLLTSLFALQVMMFLLFHQFKQGGEVWEEKGTKETAFRRAPTPWLLNNLFSYTPCQQRNTQ